MKMLRRRGNKSMALVKYQPRPPPLPKILKIKKKSGITTTLKNTHRLVETVGICTSTIQSIMGMFSSPEESNLVKNPELPVKNNPEESVKPKKSMDDLLKEARKKYGVDYISKFNIVVCGASGAGKSTFINSFLALEGKDAAAVGVVETTKESNKYINPEFPNLVLWDVPGANTDKHPAATYFEDKALYAFDCILLLTSVRFCEVDSQIVEQAKKWKKPIAVVRTKADEDIKNLAREKRFTMLQASEFLRSELLQESYKKIPNDHYFIISSLAFLTKMKPYWNEGDTSLKRMDEERLLDYINLSLGSRFNPTSISQPTKETWKGGILVIMLVMFTAAVIIVVIKYSSNIKQVPWLSN